MRLAFTSDIHLNHAKNSKIKDFIDCIKGIQCRALLIAGDICDGSVSYSHIHTTKNCEVFFPDVKEKYLVCFYLRTLKNELDMPVYFVLGNHDFYHNSFSNIRKQVKDMQDLDLCFLENVDDIDLGEGVGLIGHSGYCDGRAGDYKHSSISLNDFRLIEEFKKLDNRKRLKFIQKMGDDASRNIEFKLKEACKKYRKILFLTHYPPFMQAVNYKEEMLSDSLPYFMCQRMGQKLLKVMKRHPENDLEVLCGHTHEYCNVEIANNVRVRVKGAKYGKPDFKLLEF